MKKIFMRLLACGMALTMALSLTACGGKEGSTSSTVEPQSSAASQPESQPESAPESQPASKPESQPESAPSVGADGKFATIADFVASDILQSQLEAQKENLGDEMSVTLAGEGNKLIYTFAFAEGIEIPEGAADTLKAGMESQASVFEAIAASISQAVEVENPVVVVTYTDSQGNEIYSQEFSAAE